MQTQRRKDLLMTGEATCHGSRLDRTIPQDEARERHRDTTASFDALHDGHQLISCGPLNTHTHGGAK